MWMAEPHLNSTKAAGFEVIAFLILLAGLMYFVKRQVWRNEH
jgi:ubiquinol-cytochrome c reductase cytochrome c1 subunit